MLRNNLLFIWIYISGILCFGSRFTEVSQFLSSYEYCLSTQDNAALGTSTVIGWTLEGDTLSMGIAATADGWVAMGFSNGNLTGMLDSDAIIGYIPGDAGAPVIDDYFIATQRTPCTGIDVGVCTDVQRGGGGANNVQNISGSQINGVTVLQFERLLISPDTNNDVDILNRTWEYFTAFHSTEEGLPMTQHTTRSDQLFFNFFETPSCPLGVGAEICSGPSRGTCRNGCCVCEAEFDGPACDQDANAAGPGGLGAVPSSIDPDDYDFSASLSPDFRIYWSVENGDTLFFAMECSGTGWCSFGPSNNDLMIDSDVVYGYIEADGTPIINDHWINERSTSCPGVCFDNDPSVGGTSDLLAFNGGEVDGNTQIIFRRRLNTGDTEGDIVIEDREMDAVFAFNPDLDGFGRHASAPSDAANRLRINFFTGEVTLADDFRLIHGILMFLAWGVIIPITSCVARYLKKYKWWFPTHWGCNVFAMFIIIASFILIVINTTVHFSRAHHILGLVIVFLLFVQVGFGTCADLLFDPDRKKVPIFPDKCHWFLGFFLIILTLLNILLGLIEFDAPIYLSALFIVWASCTLIISVLLAYSVAICTLEKKTEENFSFVNEDFREYDL